MTYAVGASRSWYDADNALHATTLQQTWTTADGRVVNIWVENSEYAPDKILASDVAALGNAFANGTSNPANPATSIYSMVTSLAGLLGAVFREARPIC